MLKPSASSETRRPNCGLGSSFDPICDDDKFDEERASSPDAAMAVEKMNIIDSLHILSRASPVSKEKSSLMRGCGTTELSSIRFRSYANGKKGR
mmetsp:Transcript_3568/g.7548  ORF Transcript_3568/g.7548 Transcript_3568/m.7548 type:complete len:94 (-) Transcript_3568:35-316(-)